MYFYVIQVFDNSYKEDIILAMTTAGIMQGTYVEGENLDNLLNNDFPIFTGFFKTQANKERISSLFFGLVDDKETVESVCQVMKDAGIDNESGEVFRALVVAGEQIG